MIPCDACHERKAKHLDLAEIQEDYTPSLGRMDYCARCVGLLLTNQFLALHTLKVQALEREARIA